MDYKTFLDKAIDLISNYYYCHHGVKLLEPMPNCETHRSDVFVVWQCKILQNYKALFSTPYDDTRYFEVTYNGVEKEFYLDCYVKEFNTKKGDKKCLKK